MNAASRIHVVAGVIINDAGDVLLALRPKHKHKGGLWEFPGGKVEAGESPRAALARELDEEIALAVEQAEPFLVIDHDYGDKRVTLDVWRVTQFNGTPHGREGQEIAWVPVAKLANYQFPEANAVIVTALQETTKRSGETG